MSRREDQASPEQKEAIDAIMNDPNRGISGYVQGLFLYPSALTKSIMAAATTPLPQESLEKFMQEKEAFEKQISSSTSLILERGRTSNMSGKATLKNGTTIQAPFLPDPKQAKSGVAFKTFLGNLSESLPADSKVRAALHYDDIKNKTGHELERAVNPQGGNVFDSPLSSTFEGFRLVATPNDSTDLVDAKKTLIKDCPRLGKASLSINGHYMSVIAHTLGITSGSNLASQEALRICLFDVAANGGLKAFLAETKKLLLNKTYQGVSISGRDKDDLVTSFALGAMRAAELKGIDLDSILGKLKEHGIPAQEGKGEKGEKTIELTKTKDLRKHAKGVLDFVTEIHHTLLAKETKHQAHVTQHMENQALLRVIVEAKEHGVDEHFTNATLEKYSISIDSSTGSVQYSSPGGKASEEEAEFSARAREGFMQEMHYAIDPLSVNDSEETYGLKEEKGSTEEREETKEPAAETKTGGAEKPELSTLDDPRKGVTNYNQAHFLLATKGLADLAFAQAANSHPDLFKRINDVNTPDPATIFERSKSTKKAVDDLGYRTEWTVANGKITSISSYIKGCSTPVTLTNQGLDTPDGYIDALSRATPAAARQVFDGSANKFEQAISLTSENDPSTNFKKILTDLVRIDTSKATLVINKHDCTLLLSILGDYHEKHSKQGSQGIENCYAISADLFEAAIQGGMPAFSKEMRKVLLSNETPADDKQFLKEAITNSITSYASPRNIDIKKNSSHRTDVLLNDMAQTYQAGVAIEEKRLQKQEKTSAATTLQRAFKPRIQSNLHEKKQAFEKQERTHNKWLYGAAAATGTGLTLAIAVPFILALAAPALLTPIGIGLAILAVLVVTTAIVAPLLVKAFKTDPNRKSVKNLLAKGHAEPTKEGSTSTEAGSAPKEKKQTPATENLDTPDGP